MVKIRAIAVFIVKHKKATGTEAAGPTGGPEE